MLKNHGTILQTLNCLQLDTKIRIVKITHIDYPIANDRSRKERFVELIQIFEVEVDPLEL